MQEALETAQVYSLRRTTLAPGEGYRELLADPAVESLDADRAAGRGAGFVRLDQLALEHLMGAR
ncbi:hypothetical protein [Nocardia carnea]|uniref:hypothetical protein n=1 Tax=Nocardia carnea TaxID=37328 RepID=UPI00245654B4|nr:hypothetical protein [Nocardia carnea]